MSCSPTSDCRWPVAGLLLALAGAAHAQQAASAAASAPAQSLGRVEITGGRAGDTEQRRRSTAAKIVVGREEIERHGDSTLGEVLKRLPGVTLQGAPGRGGGIRMRGLGGVNIVSREGFRQRLNDLKLGFRVEHGELSPGLSWTRNQAFGDWTANLSLSAFRQRNVDDTTTSTIVRAPDGSTLFEQKEREHARRGRRGLHLSSRLQWRGEGGRSLTLSPILVHSEGRRRLEATLHQAIPEPATTPPLYDHSTTDGDSRASSTANTAW